MAQQPEKPKQELTPGQQQALDDARDRIAREKEKRAPTTKTEMGKIFKKGGSVKSSASRRGDGIAQRGKTKGRLL